MTFFYDMNKKLASVLKSSETLNESARLDKQQVQEKWDTETKVSPAEKGKYAGQTKAELLKQYNALKASGPHKQGSADFGKMRELAFAIRAKSGWGKVDEADMGEGNEFSGALAKAKAAGAKEFKVDGKTYTVNEAKSKPDFLDLDKDGDRTEPMKKAAKDKTYRHKGTYGTSYDPSEEEKERLAKKDTGIKKGRGRPKKGADSETGEVKKWDFSAFGVGNKDVKLPKHSGKVTKHKMVGEAEPGEEGEYGREGDMAKEQLHTIKAAAAELKSILSDEQDLPEWVQSKITKAMDYIDTARDYMLSQRDDMTDDLVTEKAVSRAQQQAAGIAYAAKKGEIPKSKLKGASKEMAKMPEKELEKFAATKRKGLPKHVDEESTDTRDDRAEKAGRKVAKDIEYDERVKDKIHGKKRGAEDDKADRAGKRVTKDIEHDEKVDETTSSGSVAVAASVAPKSKKGVTYGKGIYDSLNREVEGMIAESMSVNMSMTSGENGGPTKSLTVTATDEDAVQLASLLKMAGLEGQSQSCDYSEVDEAYGDTTPTENEPDYPTDEEYSSDALQYSGGLNKPKQTGQTTIPVIASQVNRQHAYKDQEFDDIRRLAGVNEGEYTQQAMDLNPNLGKQPGLADKIKASVKKIANVVAPDDETLLKDLQKKTGQPQTGKKPEDLAEQLKRQLQNFKG